MVTLVELSPRGGLYQRLLDSLMEYRRSVSSSEFPGAMMSGTANTLIQRRGSLVQRRNSKRFVLSELGSAAATVGALVESSAAVPSTLIKENCVGNQVKDDFVSLNDEDGSDDDDVIKVPDIVLDIRETSSPAPSSAYDDSASSSPPEILDWRFLKMLKSIT